MAEEKTSEPRSSLAISKVILGLVFLALGAIALMRWWGELLVIAKGGLGLFLLLAGVITLAIAKE